MSSSESSSCGSPVHVGKIRRGRKRALSEDSDPSDSDAECAPKRGRPSKRPKVEELVKNMQSEKEQCLNDFEMEKAAKKKADQDAKEKVRQEKFTEKEAKKQATESEKETIAGKSGQAQEESSNGYADGDGNAPKAHRSRTIEVNGDDLYDQSDEDPDSEMPPPTVGATPMRALASPDPVATAPADSIASRTASNAGMPKSRASATAVDETTDQSWEVPAEGLDYIPVDWDVPPELEESSERFIGLPGVKEKDIEMLEELEKKEEERARKERERIRKLKEAIRIKAEKAAEREALRKQKQEKKLLEQAEKDRKAAERVRLQEEARIRKEIEKAEKDAERERTRQEKAENTERERLRREEEKRRGQAVKACDVLLAKMEKTGDFFAGACNDRMKAIKQQKNGVTKDLASYDDLQKRLDAGYKKMLRALKPLANNLFIV